MRSTLKILGIIALLLFLLIILFTWMAGIPEPEKDLSRFSAYKAHTSDSILFYTDGAWLQQNDKGLNELYVEGSPLEIGYKRGLLSEKLIHKQEKLFVERIMELIPSKTYLRILKELVAWFNRNLPEYIQPEQLDEIYGVSRFASNEYDFIGNKYERVINYHAAHDIGHALENYNLVGCTSFSTWQPDGSNLLVGRNFDFSLGEAFAENKIICFYRPDEGIPFAMIAWSDFIGCVSGMNLEGLTVTINAGENEIPTELGTPISLIAREILQYAQNIDEAFEIASSRKAYVSESFLIGSAQDKMTAIIEKTPDTTILVLPDDHQIICSNHFLSNTLKSDPDPATISASRYRYATLEKELEKSDSLGILQYANLLRKRSGLEGANIGIGSEKSINQLVAHHSIIFQPDKRRLWVSTPPYQLGEFLCYDLNNVFRKARNMKTSSKLYAVGETISKDEFLSSTNYQGFLEWREIKSGLESNAEGGSGISEGAINHFISLNPAYFYTYELVGNHYLEVGNPEVAIKYYKLALERELSNPSDRKRLTELLAEAEKSIP